MPVYTLVDRSGPDLVQAFRETEEVFAALARHAHQPWEEGVVLVGDSRRAAPPTQGKAMSDLPPVLQQHIMAYQDGEQRGAKTMAYAALYAYAHFFARFFPTAWQLQRNPFGKPFWSTADAAFAGGFSLSDAGPYWALAIGPSPMGIDIEKERTLPDWQDLAKACFSPQEQTQILDWQALDPPPAFFRLWTQKEALLKARGREMPDDLSQWSALAGQHAVAGETQLGDLAEATLQCRHFQPLPGLHLALTLPLQVKKLFFFTNLHP